jgi:hypothetical protein
MKAESNPFSSVKSVSSVFNELNQVRIKPVLMIAEIMKRQTAIILTLILTILFGCKNDREFSEVRKLSAFTP